MLNNSQHSNHSIYHVVQQLIVWKGESYPLIVPPLLLLSCVALLANAIVLLSVAWLPRKKSINLVLCISLAAADTFASLWAIVDFVFGSYFGRYFLDTDAETTGKRIARCLMVMLSIFKVGAHVTSALHILTIALNHLYGAEYPLHYKAVVTKRVCYITLAVTWLVPVSSLILRQAINEERSICQIRIGYEDRLGFFLFYLTSFCLTALVYVHLLIIKNQTTNSTAIRRHVQGGKESSTKAIKVTLMITVSFAACLIPYSLIAVLICPFQCWIEMYQSVAVAKFAIYLNFTRYVLLLLKLLSNALIYTFRLPEMRCAFKAMASQLLYCSRTTAQSRRPSGMSQYMNGNHHHRHSSVIINTK